MAGVVAVNMSLFISTLMKKRTLISRIFQIVVGISIGYSFSAIASAYEYNSLYNDIHIPIYLVSLLFIINSYTICLKYTSN